MNREDKQRVIGKVVALNSDRFTVELLMGLDNFNINGFDDIHYFAQLNSYVVVPYQNYYIIAEVAGVREKDLNVPFSNPTEQFLNKIKSGKFLEVIPIGTLRQVDPPLLSFEFGVGVYPALYSDVLYIKEAELDAIFNVSDNVEIVHQCAPDGECTCNKKRYKTLSLGKSTIFPDYDIKIDIDKFFGGHAAILGNTGSGKSCTISSIIQELFRYTDYSATGSSFIFFDVNGEYQQAFSQINSVNSDIRVKHLQISEEEKLEKRGFFLPHWFFSIEEWALLLQASEKTQLPLLRNALGIASEFSSNQGIDNLKNHILSTCITQILMDETGSPSKKDRIHSILQKFSTSEISLDGKFDSSDTNGNIVKGITIRKCIEISFGEMKSIHLLHNYLSSQDSNGKSKFFLDGFTMPVYEKNAKFNIDILVDALDLALLYEEAHGNRHIRDYCASLVTRLKSIIDRKEFNFLKKDCESIDTYVRMILGLFKLGDEIRKKHQIVIIDLNNVDDEVVEVISCVLSRIVYESIKQFSPRNNYPVNLILEEAHRYIGDDPHRSFLRANKIFETVAKEGRKFGLFLLISSQRPSELSRTVLSQCSNFIVHRIQNPEDLSHIRQITPHISDTILRRLPSIPTQHALIFGNSVNLPATFKVNSANPKPKSDNNQISKNWFKEKDHLLLLAKPAELKEIEAEKPILS